MTVFKIANAANFDFVVRCDTDGQHPVELIPALVEKAITEKMELLIGSQFTKMRDPKITQEVPLKRLESTTLSRRIGGWLIRVPLLFFSGGREITDPTSGLRVYSRSAFLTLLSQMPDEYPEAESIAILLARRLSVVETLVRMSPRKVGLSSISGIKSVQFVLKVMSALFGLQIRTLFL